MAVKILEYGIVVLVIPAFTLWLAPISERMALPVTATNNRQK